MNNTLNMENPCESIYEQMMPEYSMEMMWTEPSNNIGSNIINGGSSGGLI